MCTLNPKATTKITNQIYAADNPSKEKEWDHKYTQYKGKQKTGRSNTG